MTDDELDRWLRQGDARSVRSDIDANVFVAGVARRVGAERRWRGVVFAGAAGVGTTVSVVAAWTATPTRGGAIGAIDLAGALVLAAACAFIWVAAGAWPAIPTGLPAPGSAHRE